MTLREKAAQLCLINVNGDLTLNKMLEQIEAGEIGGIFNTIIDSPLSQMQERALKSPNKTPLFWFFDNITLKPHTKDQVKFVIKYDMLKFWNNKMQYVAEPGKFNVYIGSDSTTQDKQTFTLLD
ncbi:MAG: fibronectin type III-like domain-contianing protein [Gilliamella sp.]|uniref:fibronectin type III-like domain-contianing protein n=1 Tax=Gilliamella sp. TaxID=1891236 RepID=UPI0025DB6E97|nr:fibronectin type III-like domain-contianing protein [Gilliamella sp.]MCO6545802.1 fibronectin type III-like domain-contianing protein [Gilliamella sp.]MCO6547622.1 fibronectin type III-like domain-contianing protein [Gilliamella sp.]